MYLSKLVLNPRHPHARRDLSDAYEMHRTLARAFAADAQAAPDRFLWRLERRVDLQPLSTVLIQSAYKADWSVLEGFDGYAEKILANKPVELNTLIAPGARYRFRLLANPTVTREGKRHGLTREEDQVAWMIRQGKQHGFAVIGCVRGANERLRVRQGRTGHHITVHAVLFDGMLESVGAEALREVIVKGVGPGKALGLGMLSVGKGS